MRNVGFVVKNNKHFQISFTHHLVLKVNFVHLLLFWSCMLSFECRGISEFELDFTQPISVCFLVLFSVVRSSDHDVPFYFITIRAKVKKRK